MDRELPWRVRAGLRLHLMMCKPCHRYNVQLIALRQIFSTYAETDSTCNLPDSQTLPEDMAKRLETTLRKEMER